MGNIIEERHNPKTCPTCRDVGLNAYSRKLEDLKLKQMQLEDDLNISKKKIELLKRKLILLQQLQEVNTELKELDV